MPDPNTNNTPNAGGEPDDNTQQNTPGATGDLQAQIQAGIDAALAPIKAKLDNAYAARDQALAKVAELETKERERELVRLREEGKHQEAAERELAEERARRTTAEKRVVELTRDQEVRDALSSFEFRNKNAQTIAAKEITSQLVQKDDGTWVHKSGATVGEFAESFLKDDSNSFMLKQKINSGGGSSSSTPADPTKAPSSLFAMKQEEVMKMAREGKLRRRR